MAKTNSLTDEEKKILVGEYFLNPVKFSQFFFPEQFPKRVPWVHRGIMAILTKKTDFLLEYGELDKIVAHFVWKDAEGVEHPIFVLNYDNDTGEVVSIDLQYTKYFELIMPRGGSKTTLVGFAMMLYYILFQEKKFIVYISETATAAEMQMDSVKGELEANSRIKQFFGNVVPERSDSEKWTSSFFETTTGITVTCRGRGGQIRGMNVSGQRPDCILCDDIEDEESVKTVEQRMKTRSWFYKAVMPALPKMDENATIGVLGTVLHQDALLKVLEKDPRWTSMCFGAIDRDGEALWPDYMTLADLEEEKSAYAGAGMLSAYYMEYESLLRADEGAKFQSSYFIVDPFILGEIDASSQVIDPAISNEPGADFSAIVNVGITTKGLIGVIDTWAKQGADPREQVDVFFQKHHLHKPTVAGFESIAYQKALKTLLIEEMARQTHYFMIQEIKHGKTGKDERILGALQPRYAAGYIRHCREFPELCEQLLDYPNGKKDIPDALAMAIGLLAPYAGNALAEGEIEEDDYIPLDVVLQGEWRVH